MAKNQKRITPYLWFNDSAEEAMNFYTGIFNNSQIIDVARFGPGGPVPAGTLMSAVFVLDGQEFNVLNGGPQFQFSEAISLYVQCENQQEVDYYWTKLSKGGEEGRCGWLKDKFGVSWQVVPVQLDKLLNDSDAGRVQRVMKAFFGMNKINVDQLEKA